MIRGIEQGDGKSILNSFKLDEYETISQIPGEEVVAPFFKFLRDLKAELAESNEVETRHTGCYR